MPAIDESSTRRALRATRQERRRRGGSGYFASFFLPRAKRDSVYAVWALAELIEQALRSSESGCCSGGAGGVARAVHERVDAIYSDELSLPLPQFRSPDQQTLAAASEAVKRYGIPRRYWTVLIDGWLAAGNIRRYATWRSLEQHCAATGGAVAKMIAAVLGMTHSDGAAFAVEVGRAARFTAILRDLKSDLSADRIYLPLEDLARFRYTEHELSTQVVNGAFVELMRFEIERARSLYRRGAEGACWLAGDGSRMAASTYIALQLELLDEIERCGFDVFRREPRVSAARQLRRLPAAWRLARRQADEPLPNVH